MKRCDGSDPFERPRQAITIFSAVTYLLSRDGDRWLRAFLRQMP